MRVQVDERPRIESTSTSSTREVRGGLGVARLPALEAGERGVLARASSRSTSERHLRARRLLRGRALRARRRDARRLALHLAEVRRPGRVAEPRRLVARGELEQRLERARGARPCRRADRRRSAKRAGTCATVKSAGSQSGTSSQRERRRHARVGQRAHRVGRAGRAVLGVLVVVEEHAVALLLPPLRGGERRRAPLDLARQRERRAAHLGEASSAARCAR